MPAHHHLHPYALQTIALVLSLIPFFLLAGLMFAASFLEGRRRSRKPALRAGIVADDRLAGATRA
ncbi:MAG TPA: hypothetical protein VIG51_02250 [Candidatus Baltobacteraceae bacterium]